MTMGLLPDAQIFGSRMRRECWARFLRHRLQRKPLVTDPNMHHDTCVTHVPWCMSGSLTRAGGENVPGILGACATRNFTFLAIGPWHLLWRHWRILHHLVMDSRMDGIFVSVTHTFYFTPLHLFHIQLVVSPSLHWPIHLACYVCAAYILQSLYFYTFMYGFIYKLYTYIIYTYSERDVYGINP